MGGGGAGGDFEFLEDVLAVELDGVPGDAEGVGNGLVGVALGDVAEDGALGGGERSQQGGRGGVGGQGGVQGKLVGACLGLAALTVEAGDGVGKSGIAGRKEGAQSLDLAAQTLEHGDEGFGLFHEGAQAVGFEGVGGAQAVAPGGFVPFAGQGHARPVGKPLEGGDGLGAIEVRLVGVGGEDAEDGLPVLGAEGDVESGAAEAFHLAEHDAGDRARFFYAVPDDGTPRPDDLGGGAVTERQRNGHFVDVAVHIVGEEEGLVGLGVEADVKGVHGGEAGGGGVEELVQAVGVLGFQAAHVPVGLLQDLDEVGGEVAGAWLAVLGLFHRALSGGVAGAGLGGPLRAGAGWRGMASGARKNVKKPRPPQWRHWSGVDRVSAARWPQIRQVCFSE